MLPQDVLTASPQIVGCYTARVALMEVLSAGAKPIAATLAACNAPEYANLVLEGVRKVIGQELPCVVSTEKNMPTEMTGVGVSISGICKTEDLRIGKAQNGDTLYCLAKPIVGAETLEPDAVMIHAELLESFMHTHGVHSLIPVGSHGIAYEASVLSKESGLSAKLESGSGIDLFKSAGPSSCAIFSADASFHPEFLSYPVTPIGKLIPID